MYFRRGIARIVAAFAPTRPGVPGGSGPEWRLPLAVVHSSIPIAVVALAGKSVIDSTLRSRCQRATMSRPPWAGP
ncbi:hypothetical protein [Phytohabitans suffuscus]